MAAKASREPPKMKRKDYEKELRALQVELCHLQDWVKSAGGLSRCPRLGSDATIYGILTSPVRRPERTGRKGAANGQRAYTYRVAAGIS